MVHEHSKTVATCSRCDGAIEMGEKVYVIGEFKIYQDNELYLIENKEKVCRHCYPYLEVKWEGSNEGRTEEILSIILKEEDENEVLLEKVKAGSDKRGGLGADKAEGDE